MYTFRFFSSALLGLSLLVLPYVASASTVVRSGESISIEQDQRIEGDFYGAASVINLSGEVVEDMTAVAGKITINGTVGADALLAGGAVDVHGTIADDLRIIAGDVTLAEPIKGNVFVIAGTVKVLSTASIGGDLVVYGGEVEVSGPITGSLIGQAETLRIDAAVGGSVDVKVTTLVLGDRAAIAGSVRHVSEVAATRAPGAQVVGEITRNDPAAVESESLSPRAIVIPFLVVLFSALVWYLIARSMLVQIVERTLTKGIRPAATGFIAFFATPLLVVILVLSVLGTLVGIGAFVAYILGLCLASFSVPAVLGTLIERLYKKKTTYLLSPLTIIQGALFLALLVIVPVVGPLLIFISILLTFGALVDLILRTPHTGEV